ncbi:hypothetical protein R3P38DRAFT_3349576 [Favolaschia claudopus]|uniref:Uncharacterized protein n=1 Tax=Favolaschia claudopus TaxID=2862362 RepID=A0AAW0CJX0_9AGAR
MTAFCACVGLRIENGALGTRIGALSAGGVAGPEQVAQLPWHDLQDPPIAYLPFRSECSEPPPSQKVILTGGPSAPILLTTIARSAIGRARRACIIEDVHEGAITSEEQSTPTGILGVLTAASPRGYEGSPSITPRANVGIVGYYNKRIGGRDTGRAQKGACATILGATTKVPAAPGTQDEPSYDETQAQVLLQTPGLLGHDGDGHGMPAGGAPSDARPIVYPNAQEERVMVLPE